MVNQVNSTYKVDVSILQSSRILLISLGDHLMVVQVKVPPLWGAVDASDGMMMCGRFARFAKC